MTCSERENPGIASDGPSRIRSDARRARTGIAGSRSLPPSARPLRSLPQLVLAIALLTACDATAPDAPRDAGSSDAGRTDGGADPHPADASIDAPAVAAPCPCFDGDGTYCEADVAARAAAGGCSAAGASTSGARLFSCASGEWTAGEACGDGCATGEVGGSAACELPACDCFVSVSWCGASAARHALTLDPPCRIPLVPEHDQDLLGCDASEAWVVLEPCEMGCAEAPTGTPDRCVSDRTPEDPGWEPCPERALIHYGVHPEASDRLRCAGVTDGMITQTIGTAAASAGYHAADGSVDGAPYTAAIDLGVRGLSESEIRALLERLGRNGFAAWYRKPGSDGWPSSQAPHIHAVFAGVVMKAELRGQVRDFLLGLNGLASHTTYRFWPPPADVQEIVRLLFSRHYSPP